MLYNLWFISFCNSLLTGYLCLILSYFYNLYLYVDKYRYYRPFEIKMKVVEKYDPALLSHFWLCIFASHCQCLYDCADTEIRDLM